MRHVKGFANSVALVAGKFDFGGLNGIPIWRPEQEKQERVYQSKRPDKVDAELLAHVQNLGGLDKLLWSVVILEYSEKKHEGKSITHYVVDFQNAKGLFLIEVRNKSNAVLQSVFGHVGILHVRHQRAGLLQIVDIFADLEHIVSLLCKLILS